MAQQRIKKYEKLKDNERQLVDSDVWYDRRLAAQCSYGLDKLVDDPCDDVRYEVAWKGYGLDKLVFDSCEGVRVAVAYMGHGLNRLVQDESQLVRDAVSNYLYSHDTTLVDWIKHNPDKCVDERKNNEARLKVDVAKVDYPDIDEPEMVI